MVADPAPLVSELRLTGAGLALAGSRHHGRPAADASPSVLYAHGFGQTRRALAATASTLAAHGHAGVAYDARGHGDSDFNADDDPYTGHQFTDDLIVLAGELPRPPVLVDITPRWESAGLERILAFMTAFPEGFASLEQAAESIAAYLPHRRARGAGGGALRGLLRQAADGRWRWHWDRRLVDELARDSHRHQDDIAAATRAVRCPLLLVSGGRSDLVSARTVADFLELAPHARHVQLPDATHMLAGDDNDLFTTTVLDYLAELEPGAAPAGSAMHRAPAPATGAEP